MRRQRRLRAACSKVTLHLSRIRVLQRRASHISRLSTTVGQPAYEKQQCSDRLRRRPPGDRGPLAADRSIRPLVCALHRMGTLRRATAVIGRAGQSPTGQTGIRDRELAVPKAVACHRRPGRSVSQGMARSGPDRTRPDVFARMRGENRIRKQKRHADGTRR